MSPARCAWVPWAGAVSHGWCVQQPGPTRSAIGFDEGLVPEDWQRRLPEAGIEVVRGVLRDEARAVMDRYVDLGGTIYNP